MNEEKDKKVFISYSWTTPRHEKWVLDLAERLVHNGVDVVLDKWDLVEGQDKYAFMEKMVQDETIDKVLIICDKGYKEKANDRQGGVGTETQIITPMLYSRAEETKFIPIIAQSGEKEFDEYMPHYLKGRIGIVMSNDESYMEGFERLLRVIYDKPMFVKPKKGKMPSFLEAESKVTSRLHFINQSLKKHIDDSKVGMIEYGMNDFKEKFFEELDNFIINSQDFKEPYDEQIVESIDLMKGIRDEYIFFLESLITGHEKFEGDFILEFFEELYSYIEYKGEGSSYAVYAMDHFKFFITELFIWTNMLLFKYRKYDIIKNILLTKYFVKSKLRREPLDFVNLRFYIAILDEYRDRRLGTKRLSITSDKLIERSDYKGKSYKKDIVDTDLILHYISVISKSFKYNWFPLTYIYKDYYSKVDFIAKMVRKKHFEEVKMLFEVKDAEEMKNKINESLMSVEIGFSNSIDYIPRITNSIKIEDIAKF